MPWAFNCIYSPLPKDSEILPLQSRSRLWSSSANGPNILSVLETFRLPHPVSSPQFRGTKYPKGFHCQGEPHVLPIKHFEDKHNSKCHMRQAILKSGEPYVFLFFNLQEFIYFT